MTGGTLVVLGSIGFNFGAGMTGGKAIVLNTQKNFKQYISETAPEYKKLTDIDKLELKTLLEVHYEKTKSETALGILKKYDNWDNMFSVFGGIAEVDNNAISKKPENIKALD
jgi:glutamate synthase (NADPH/NADH) large chain